MTWHLECLNCGFRLPDNTAASPTCPDCGARMDVKDHNKGIAHTAFKILDDELPELKGKEAIAAGIERNFYRNFELFCERNKHLAERSAR